MESFEKIITNCDVLQSIFHYLDIKDHLKLMKICPQFQYAIVNGVWRLNNKNLKNLRIRLLYEFNPLEAYNVTERPLLQEVFQIFLQHSSAECLLSPEEFQIFLQYSSMFINKFEMNEIRHLENIISFDYQRLTELKIFDTFVKDTHLQQIAKNCLNLQCLTLLSFTNFEKESNISVNVFGKMKSLHRLEISDKNFKAWNSFDLQSLYCLAHLKTLILNIPIRVNITSKNRSENNSCTERVYNIKNLSIGEYGAFSPICKDSFIKHLTVFKNLIKLSITCRTTYSIVTPFNDKVLTEISYACPKLSELSFAGWYFSFRQFPPINNLHHLTFEQCDNLRLSNFGEILQNLELKSLRILYSAMVRGRGNSFHSYRSSNSLETLCIEILQRPNIITAFCKSQNKFKNVSQVRLSRQFVIDSQSTRLCFSRSFPHLQELIMDSFYISIEDILHLEHLRVLEFNIFANMSWSYLEILFQHPKLTRITITGSLSRSVCRGFKRDFQYLPKCYEDFTTTLEYLNLPSIVYKEALSFWPLFQQRNKRMKLNIAHFN